jgi:predicted Zn-dependent protease with MMP-like domain
MPDIFRRHLEDVVLRVEEFAEEDVLAQFGIEDPFELTGLYSGRSLREQSSSLSGRASADDPPLSPPFARRVGRDGRWPRSADHARHRHEAGHHFGFSDEDMHAIEDAAG